MRTLISFTLLCIIKLVAQIFYKVKVSWLSEEQDFDKIRLMVMLNHTSLYEPLWVGAAPYSFLWRIARKLVIPVADKTLNRPLVGIFFKILIPGIISVTRKRDASWRNFLQAVENKSIIFILPEGRMKRNNGLDSDGKPMTVRSGVAEILSVLNEGNILFAYSGGLHHVQAPGQFFPKLFQTLELNLEKVDINDYKSHFSEEKLQFMRGIVADLNNRLQTKCPNQLNSDKCSA